MQDLLSFPPRSFDSTVITVLQSASRDHGTFNFVGAFSFSFSCFFNWVLAFKFKHMQRISHTGWSFVDGNYRWGHRLWEAGVSKKFLTLSANDGWCRCMILSALKCFQYINILRAWAWKTTANNGSLNMNLSELDIVFFLCKRPKLVPCLRLSCLIINCILF